MDKISTTWRNLAHNPAIGRARPELRGRGALFFPASSWLIMYRPLPDFSGIRIVRIIHGRRDLSRAVRE
jgi:plasmid stabilization system protein ParE